MIKYLWLATKYTQRKVSSMINSIRYFEEECINRFEKLEDDFMKEPQKLAEYVLGLTEELHNLGLRMIQESLGRNEWNAPKSRKTSTTLGGRISRNKAADHLIRNCHI